jgi:hypothetical protein
VKALARLRALAAAVLRPAPRPEDVDEMAQLLARVLPVYLQEPWRAKYFSLWQQRGFHVTPVHFYQPIPDTGALPDTLWRDSELVGVDMNGPGQLALLMQFPRFQAEYDEIAVQPTPDPREPCLDNPMFNATDALVYYCMVRHFRPRTVLEVGSGFSSRLSARAAVRNGDTRLVCIEPHPDATLTGGFPGLTSLIPSRVQDVGFQVFQALEANDILFVDSSHVVKFGSDVNFLFLEVFPRLRPGVIVHVHDIFLPHELPKAWIKDLHLFWNEQYLLHAFLIYNRAFEVLYSNPWITMHHLDAMKAVFPRSPWYGGTSFWMRRTLA